MMVGTGELRLVGPDGRTLGKPAPVTFQVRTRPSVDGGDRTTHNEWTLQSTVTWTRPRRWWQFWNRAPVQVSKAVLTDEGDRELIFWPLHVAWAPGEDLTVYP